MARRFGTVAAVLAAALATAGLRADEPPAAQADLGVRVGATKVGGKWEGGAFERRSRIEVGPDHAIGDGLIAYEGPGWESDRVGYRLYLDERNVTDVFGKRRPEPVLHRVGRGDDYHALSDWGMDVLKVGDSLGVGGLGLWRDGRAAQVGPARSIEAAVVADGPRFAAVEVSNRGLRYAGGEADLTARYEIAAGSRLTRVTAEASRADYPLVAGLVRHPGMTVLERRPQPGRAWGYVATHGVQSLANDALGLVVFYPDAAATGDDGHSLWIRFGGPRADYAFAAVWAQEPGAPVDAEAFAAWLDHTAEALAAPR